MVGLISGATTFVVRASSCRSSSRMRILPDQCAIDPPDHRYCWLLRVPRDRPRDRRPAEERDEFAAFHHSITSSARASSASGTVMPSALAVLRLIVSWYFVGC